MGIITISRGIHSGGRELAGLLAKRMGYRTVRRSELYERVEHDYGLSARQAAEIMEQAPGQVELSGEASQRISMGQRRRRLFFALQASLCKLLSGGDAVYTGHAGHLLFPGFPHVLRVRLVATREARVDRAMERERLGRLQAIQRLDLLDGRRRRWTRTFYNATWGDPALYDVVLNLAQMSLEEAASVVAHTVALPSYELTDEAAQAFADLSQDARVTARLLAHPNTGHLQLDVVVHDGVVRITGLRYEGDAKETDRIVRGMEGVAQLELPGWSSLTKS